jgi:NTE family protein
LREPSGGVVLALSGGAARGIAHIAVLEVLEREGIPVKAVAGTSAGSIIGALYAAGVSVEEMKRIALETGWKTFLRPTLPTRGLIPSRTIYSFVKDVLPVRKFSQLRMPFAAVATDLRTGDRVNLRSGSLARAVQASCSLPVVFTPTTVGGRLLVDGGVTSMVPVRTARDERGGRTVIAVNVNSRAVGPERYDSLLKIAVQVSNLWATRNSREEERLADVVIHVSASGIPLFDLRKARELLRRGRKAAERKVNVIRRCVKG